MNFIISIFYIFVYSNSVFIDTPKNQISFYDDVQQTQNSFLEHIPIETSLQTAKEILKNNKLNYEVYLKQDFTHGVETLKRIDFLYINKIKSKGWVSKRWQVAVAFKNDKITGIYVSYGLIGM